MSRPKALMLCLCLSLSALAPSGRLMAGCDDDPTVAPRLKAVNADAKNVGLRFNLAAAYYNKECYDDALGAFRKAIDTNSGDKAAHKEVDWEAWQVIGMINYQVKKEDGRSVEAFKKSLELKPGEPDTLYGLSLALTRLEKFEQAEPYLKEALSGPKKLEGGKALDANFRLAVILNKKWEAGGRKDAALVEQQIVAFAKAANLAAGDRDANKELLLICYNQLGLLFKAQNNHPKAIEYFTKVIKINPDDYQANFLLGLEYYASKEYDKMIEAYERATKASPNEVDARFNLGVAYMNQQRYDEAAEQFKKISELDSHNSEALTLLAQATEQAIDQQLKVGTTAFTEERFGAARDAFSKVLQLDPGNKTAKKYLSEAGKKADEEFDAHMKLADKARAKKDRLGELTELELALALKPGDASATQRKEALGGEISSLLQVYMSRGKKAAAVADFSGAMAEYDKALRLKPGYPAAVQARAAAEGQARTRISSALAEAQRLLIAGELRKAKGKYEAVLDTDPKNKDARLGLTKANTQISDKVKLLVKKGQEALQAGNKADARAAFDRALSLDPNSQAANDGVKKITGSESTVKVKADEVKKLYYEGVDYYVNGQIEKAIAAWDKVLSMQPDNKDALKNKERAQEKLAAIKKLKG